QSWRSASKESPGRATRACAISRALHDACRRGSAPAERDDRRLRRPAEAQGRPVAAARRFGGPKAGAVTLAGVLHGEEERALAGGEGGAGGLGFARHGGEQRRPPAVGPGGGDAEHGAVLERAIGIARVDVLARDVAGEPEVAAAADHAV